MADSATPRSYILTEDELEDLESDWESPSACIVEIPATGVFAEQMAEIRALCHDQKREYDDLIAMLKFQRRQTRTAHEHAKAQTRSQAGFYQDFSLLPDTRRNGKRR
jgi:hypothetical protein